jgi:hypothetical protein
MDENPDIFILSPEFRMRYLRSTVNPWGEPSCDEKLYHGYKEECLLTKSIVHDRSEYDFIQLITETQFVPEQKLFNSIWDAYDIFEQKFYLYKKVSKEKAPK